MTDKTKTRMDLTKDLIFTFPKIDLNGMRQKYNKMYDECKHINENEKNTCPKCLLLKERLQLFESFSKEYTKIKEDAEKGLKTLEEIQEWMNMRDNVAAYMSSQNLLLSDIVRHVVFPFLEPEDIESPYPELDDTEDDPFEWLSTKLDLMSRE